VTEKNAKKLVSPDIQELLSLALGGRGGPGVFSSQAELAKELSETSDVYIGRNDISSAKNGKPIRADAADALTLFIKMPDNYTQIGRSYHQSNWTKPFLSQAGLKNTVPAKFFKQKLIEMVKKQTSLKMNAIFVTKSGQWLKQVLKYLLKYEVEVVVYVAGLHAEPSTASQVAHNYAVSQFLWSLPNIVPHDVDIESRLTIRTYDPSSVATPFAILGEDLIGLGISDLGGLDKCPPPLQGHPLETSWPEGVREKYNVSVYLRYHKEFEKIANQIHNFNIEHRHKFLKLDSVENVLKWNSLSGFSILNQIIFAGYE